MNRNNSIIAVFVLLLTLVILPGLKTQATEIALVQPELEYLFMDDGQADDGLGKLVIASIKTEGLQLETAALEYKDSETGETVQVPSDEIIEGYAAFLIKTEVTQTDLLKLSLQLNGEAFDIDLAEFYQASDVEEVEVEAVEDNDVPLEESLSIEEIQDIVADGSEDIETVLEQSNDIVPRSGNLIQSFAKGNVIVVLDPGHGGSDPGAPSNPITYNGVTYIEKTIALKIALATKAELEKYTGVTVYMTRSDDRALTLKERVDFGKAKGATVFVSQHLNASGTGKVRGALVLVSKGQYRPELGQASGDLAKKILSELSKLGFANKGLQYRLSEENNKYPNGELADYYGIVKRCVEAGFPGMIVEHGFIDSLEEIKQLYSSEEKIRAIGAADATAIANYYGLTKGAYTGWRNVNGTYYYYQSGAMVKGWLNLAGVWYFLDDSTGAMHTGWLWRGGNWFYLTGSGAMAKGWYQVNGSWYYSKSTGEMLTGTQTINGSIHYLDSNGAALTGRQTINGKVVYLDEKGKETKEVKAGWKLSNGSWYYYKTDGNVYKGWLELNGVWYYLNPQDGKMQTGWYQTSSGWYYSISSGAMQTGWTHDGWNWYYMNSSGTMQTGWTHDGRNWYYMNSSGAMQTGWTHDGWNWYYMNSSGAMQTGWIYVNGIWYYGTQDGSIYQNCIKQIGGKSYNFAADGGCTNPYQ